MEIQATGIYHIYNRGNNKQKIFFSHENYFYFLRKCHKYLKPVSEIFAWCLMPNHFHFLIEVTEKSLVPVRVGNLLSPSITNGFRLLQSSYAKGINKQQNRTGNLFQQKTKSKLVSANENYPITAFHYIHQNPVSAGLVRLAEAWPFSSFADYAGLRNGSLCNTKRAMELLELTDQNIRQGISIKLNEDIIQKIWVSDVSKSA